MSIQNEPSNKIDNQIIEKQNENNEVMGKNLDSDDFEEITSIKFVSDIKIPENFNNNLNLEFYSDYIKSLDKRIEKLEELETFYLKSASVISFFVLFLILVKILFYSNVKVSKSNF